MVTRGKSSILNTVTREVCRDCDHELGKLEQAVEPGFPALAQAAEAGAPLVLDIDSARMHARWAKKAITNELTSSFPGWRPPPWARRCFAETRSAAPLSGPPGIQRTTRC